MNKALFLMFMRLYGGFVRRAPIRIEANSYTITEADHGRVLVTLSEEGCALLLSSDLAIGFEVTVARLNPNGGVQLSWPEGTNMFWKPNKYPYLPTVGTEMKIRQTNPNEYLVTGDLGDD